MKKKLSFTLSALALSAVMCFGTACGGTPDPDPGPDDGNEETYTITFKDGDTVIKTETAKRGEKVSVPAALTNEDSRYSFTNWSGLAADATEVTVLADRTYNAVWYEMFGSNKTFGVTQINLTKSISVDGTGDEDAWNDATALPMDENGSTLQVLWDSEALYLYAKIVKPEDGEVAAQADDEEEIEAPGEGEEEKAHDQLIVTLDLLHSEELASDNWNGRDWGGVYRGEPGPMVEGGYTIDLVTSDVAKTWEWLSAGGYGNSDAKSVATDDGYTVEFKIDLSNSNIGEYKPAANQEIGLAVRTADGTSALESFKGYGDHGPKSLSNMKLMLNGANADVVWSAKEVRELYDITVDGEEDANLYMDAGVYEEEDYTVKALWKEGKLYLLAEFTEYEDSSDEVQSLEVTAFGKTVTLTHDNPEVALEADDIALNGFSYLTVKADGEIVIDGAKGEGVITLSANNMNYGKQRYEAKQLAAGATIEVDGILDSAYGEKVGDINVITERANDSAPASTGEFYIRWDDEFLYVFVDVTDSDVSTAQRGDPYANDSVEVWLDTCQQFQKGQGWGGDNRPVGLYRGEGGFRVLAGKVGADSGQHWLWDDERTRPTTASVVTETGYTVEYKIPWGKKLDGAEGWDDGFANYIPATGEHADLYADSTAHTNKVGQIVTFMININDDNGQDGVREGVTSLNAGGNMAWDSPRVLTQLKLVAAD